MKKILSSIIDGKGFDIALVALPLTFLLTLSGIPLVYNVLMSFQQWICSALEPSDDPLSASHGALRAAGNQPNSP